MEHLQINGRPFSIDGHRINVLLVLFSFFVVAMSHTTVTGSGKHIHTVSNLVGWVNFIFGRLEISPYSQDFVIFVTKM